MKDSELRMIETMLKKQAKLDKAIMEEYKLTEINKENLKMAILDEVGELTHELKGNWCWWKKTQPQVDEEKVLGELVDIWHFALSYQNHFCEGEKALLSYSNENGISYEYLERLINKKYKFPVILAGLSNQRWSMLNVLIAITEYLGFTVEQVYEAYCDKNKINYQRLKEGY